MTAKERDKQIVHWQKCIERMEQECCKYVRLCGSGIVPQSKKCSDLRQQIYYAESRIEQIREEWRKGKLSECNGNCKPTVMSYDVECPIHGFI